MMMLAERRPILLANARILDPSCDLDIVPPGGRDTAVRYLVKNSFGFGGINATLVLKRYS